MVRLVLYVTCFVVFSMHTGITHGFTCYRDHCVAGRQYCVEERERCFHCSDRESECGQATMPADCGAYCAEVELKRRLSELNGTNENLRTQTLQCSGDLNKTHSENTQLNAQIKDSQQKAAISQKENRKFANEIAVLKNETKSPKESMYGNSEIHSERIKYLQNVIADWRIGCIFGWVLLSLSIFWQSKNCLRRLFKRRRNLTDNAKLLGNHELSAPAREPEPEVTVDIDMHDKECAPEYEDSGQGSTSSLDSEVRDRGNQNQSEITSDRQTKKRAGPMSDGGCECRHSHGTGVKPCKCNQPVEPTKGKNSERAAMVLNPTPAMTYPFPSFN
ncbi:uncharacterized protein LOC124289696 [Haliotis rubra]|uniref:uncharacterized protein LOC124289696 n=1 Tax=Haliotis rubra TaxID=36100 RepID=UPI001EE5407B|nr:uncharacterized protein LOC124289696 [Haliotis rubra]XP_046582280.1 uncharacterized protein LOC124289696 [Haliotis rubra]